MKKYILVLLLGLALGTPSVALHAQSLTDYCVNQPYGQTWRDRCNTIVSICNGAGTTDEATYFEYSCDKILAKANGGSGQTNPPANSCKSVTSQNYPTCCPLGRSVSKACADYKVNLCFASPTDPLCQSVIRGGTLPGGPTNGGSAGTGAGTIAPTPKASSAELKSCSAISFDSLLDILIWAKCVIAASIIPLIFTLAFLFFLWGMFKYIRDADDVKKREESKKFIYYGIIGLTVMIAVWGIVQIVTTTFGLGNTVPQLQTDCLTTNSKNPCKQ